MLEALLALLALALLVGLVTSVVGLVILFRRKHRRVAVIGGAVSIASFVLFAVVGAFLPAPDTAENGGAMSIPTDASHPSPLDKPVPVTLAPSQVVQAAPTKLPYRGLGIGHRDAWKPFERAFGMSPMIPNDDYYQSSGSVLLTGNQDGAITVVFLGQDNDVRSGSIRFTWGVFNDAVDMWDTTVDGMTLLIKVALPGWNEYAEWLDDAMSESKDTDYCKETFIGDSYVSFHYEPPYLEDFSSKRTYARTYGFRITQKDFIYVNCNDETVN